MIKEYDVAVIGGGPAGMAAALAANEQGSKTLLIEREGELGGILNQCIHNGFGLHYYGEELTGPEYARRFSDKIKQLNIDYLTNTFVIELTKDHVLTLVNADEGIIEIKAKAVVLAMGCRERTAGAIALPGDRPSGIWTAGFAQKLCNKEGFLAGKKVVILGSGDIGLIMARRMTFEGAKVLMVCELMPYSTGLKRNIVQCLDDFGIPLLLSTTVVGTKGKKRLEGVCIADVDEKLNPIMDTKRFVPCDALLLSVGLIPENDLVKDIGITFHQKTNGAVVNDLRQTDLPWLFSCGNVLHVHDLVDNVTNEGLMAGKNAALFAKGELIKGSEYNVTAGESINYVLPQRIVRGDGEVTLYYRASQILNKPKLIVKTNDKIIFQKRYAVLSPGEMEKITLNKELIEGDITVYLEK
jgi:NADPH-dependent 2,4-dienoyl-CoA reductase/sulfur reductase-like enzyme